MAYKKLKFTDEELEHANNIDLIDYARKKGLETKKVGSNSYHIKGYGGLYINPKLNVWNCFSQGKGGGPIQFVMFIRNIPWVESVKELLDIGVVINSHAEYFQPKNEIEPKEEFTLPEKNNTYKHVIAYLIKTRKIHKDLVYKLIKDGKLYEDKNRNCVFIGTDNNNIPRYANLRSSNTNVDFKGDAKNSNKSYPFVIKGKSTKVFVFEAPIEAMSYLTILKVNGIDSFNHHAIALGGVSDIGLKQYLEDNSNISSIVLCLNNDNPGIEATEKIKKKYKDKYRIEVQYPASKDYNEDLIKGNIELNNEKEESFCYEL